MFSPAFATPTEAGFLLIELLHLAGWSIAITGSEDDSAPVVLVARRRPYTIRMTGPSSEECVLPVYCAAMALRRSFIRPSELGDPPA